MYFVNSLGCVLLFSITFNIIVCVGESEPDIAVEKECADDELMCQPSGRCIPSHWKCDGTPDCEDGSDELEECAIHSVCKSTHFMCKESKKCIPQDWVCDGEPDCSRYGHLSDTSDEDPLRCGLEKCPWNNVRCGNTSKCIHISQFCDGKPQCQDSYDEGKFCDSVHCLTMSCVSGCRETPKGALCYCPPGYHVYNRTNCSDSDECELDGSCDQKCRNTVGSFLCSCVSGYKLVGTNTCKAINVPENEDASLMFISSKGIRRLKLNGEEWTNPDSQPDVPGVRYSMSLEVDHRNRSLCFVKANVTSEITHSAIVCLNIDDPSETWNLPATPLFSLASMTVIALDWISGNWYLLDLSRQIIYVCTNDMGHCLIIIDVGLNKARSIALDPTVGYMFFTKWGSETPSLERALLDGTERIELVNKSIVYPYGLTADLANKHIFWVDTYLDVVERIDYYGKNRKVIRKGYPVQNLFDITVFENNLYVSSWRNHSVIRMNKFGIDDFQVIANVSRSLSIHVFHRQRQPDVAHPCKNNRGGCDQICVPLWKNRVAHAACYCQDGYRLINDKHCRKISLNTFLIFGQLGMIKGLSLVKGKKTESQIVLPITVMQEPVSLDVDVSTKYVYFSDFRNFAIWRTQLFSTKEPENFISTGEKTQVGGLAVDWLGRNLYWTDTFRASIMVANLSDPSMRTTILTESQKHFKSIVLDPERGFMYWSHWVYKSDAVGNAEISLAWMDGNNRKPLVTEGLHWPNGLSIDTLTNTLYWCDTFLNTIESISVDDPIQRKKLFEGTDSENPYGLAHFDNFLFWTEYNKHTVRRMNLSDPAHSVTTLSTESRHLYELKVYDISFVDSHIGFKSKCVNCNGLCLPIPGGSKCLNVSELITTVSKVATNSTGQCPEGLFDCKTPQAGLLCIDKDFVCDGHKHCINGTDEDISPTGPCANFTCNEGMFNCDDTKCLTKSEVCDGVEDCHDGKDEASCEQVICRNKNQFKCKHGRCIPSDWVCDGEPDCGLHDTSDEPPSCANTTNPSTNDSLLLVDIHACDIFGFTCKNNQCIPYKYVCDGEDDCLDNSDESNCPPDMCSPYQFTCRHENGSRAGCIPVSQWCDGNRDCPYGSDEVMCPPPCGHKEIRCYGKPQTCYPVSFRCDGKVDCELGEDEAGCECDRAMGLGNLNDKFQCDQSTCIDWNKTCDGVKDCPMGQDEGPFCPGGAGSAKPSIWECDHPNRLCDNGTVCVTVQELCDGKSHCKDGSDEGLLCDEDQCRSSLVCSHHCHNAPEGVVCWCPRHLYLQTDNTTCLSTHPCSAWGTCSQNCHMIGNRHKCTCNEGYTLQPDGFTCKTNEGGVAMVIYSNRHELRGVDLRTLSVKPLISSLKNTIAIDFLHNSSSDLVFWTDVIDDKIYRGTLISGSIGNIEVVVQTGLSTAEGLAVDWIGLNLYWVESNLDQIEVAKINGSFRRTLVAGDMESPRAIALDPRYGLLFWSDWDTNAPRIERCSLAGDSRTIVVKIDRVSDGAWPNGLTLDYQLERIYWIDARSDSIHTVRYDGSAHHMVMRGHETLSHPFSISLFEGHVYWTDWRTNSVVRANKWNGTQVTVLQRSLTQPFDIQILHPSRQPKAKFNPCGINNGNCSHLCLLSLNGTRRCECPHVMRLASDNVTCIVNEKVLVLSCLNEIRGVDLYQPYYYTIPAISLPHTNTPTLVQMDYIASTKEIYWAEGHSIEVKKTPLTGGTIQTVLDTGIEQPMGFAIDWMSGNMFIGCASANTIKIVVSTLQGEYLTTVFSEQTNSPVSEMQTPQARLIKCLAVDPYRGKMYWSEWDKNGESLINKANMDGTNVTTLINEFNKTSSAITSLSIDYEQNRIYWVSSSSLSILWMDIATGKITSLEMPKGSSPLAATLYKDLIYYSDQSSQAIYSADKDYGKNNTLVRNNTGVFQNQCIVNSVKIYDSVAQGGTNLCSVNRGNCSHLCLPVSETKRVCVCATGYSVDPKNETNCIGTEELLVYSMNWEMRGLSLESNESSVLGPISRVSMATSIDFQSGKDYLYWGDSEHGTITRIHRDGTGRQIIIGHLDNVDVSHVTSDWFSGLAVDWVADNIYWTDIKHKVIEVSRTNGSCQYVVVHERLDYPGSVAVDPPRGLLFWADKGRKGSLSRAALDGSSRSYVIPPPYPGQITDIALHYEEMKVFWCDANSNIIGRVDYNGSGIETILNHSMAKPFAIAIHGNKLYWIDVSFDKGTLKTMDLNIRKPKTLLSGLGDSLKDIVVFSPARENMGTNPCAIDNGGCKELCLFNGKEPVCACSHGKVAADKKSCEDYDALLMYSAVNRIESVHLTDASNHNAPHPPIHSRELMRNAIGLAYDYFSKTLFYSDIQKGSINAVHFNGTNHRLLLQRQGSVEGLAYQSSSNTLFWTCNNDPTIHSANLSEEVLTPKTVIKLGISDKPRGIVVESCHGHMYWANWNSQHPGIHRAFTSGYQQEVIITTDIKMPNALALDEPEAKLYWGDARLDKIERCDLNGQNRMILTHAKTEHIFSMAVYGDFIFWTDWVQRAVLRANKYTTEDQVWLRRELPRPMGIVAIANISNECVLNGCLSLNGGCSDVCTQDDNGHPLCTCKPGRKLDIDLHTCSPMLPPGENQTCPQGFMCGNLGCIPYHLTCDGIQHCSDGSDEETIYCATRSCKDGFFRCHNGRCIPNSHVCDGENHCGDSADEANCTCSSVGHFRCASGKCIPIKFRCDQDPDCPDVSDEIGCPLKECMGDGNKSPLIHCNHTTACIHPNWICDGQDDCWDNSDEENCPDASKPGNNDFTCSSTKFTCASGQCIKLNWKCDGEEDCHDGSDEKDCTYVCRSDQFACKNLDCIPHTWVCDGSPDCADETDEHQNCKERECSSSEFRCDGSDRCIPESWVCDGMGDCTDKSDEFNCSVAICWRQDQFQCLNTSRCLEKEFYCDGEDDCGDNSDEPEGCSGPMAPSGSKSCGAGYLRCANSRCIRSDLACNHKDDCGDNSDEKPLNPVCLSNATCSGVHEFECNNKLCINTTLLCDGNNDCGDYSDEDKCNINECMDKVCRHECVDLPIGYRCECNPGFRSKGYSCEDIDECSELSPCSQICNNTHGSYTCSCNDGYVLHNNTCKQDSSEKPELIFSNKYYVRKLSLLGETNILIRNLTNAVALDFDWLEHCVYWSDVTALRSSIKRWCNGSTTHQVIHSATLQNPDGLAVDWVGRNLYWCDKGLDTIEVSRLDGLFRKVLIKNNLSEPRAIALYPQKGVMFWSDWGEDAHIGKAGMDGSEQRRIVYTNLGWPNAITIDYETDTLYWADAREDYIARSDLLGNNVVHILNRDTQPGLKLHHVFAITVWEDYIYWTDWETMTVERCNRITKGDCKTLIKLVHRPMDIRLHHQLRQKPMLDNPCENGGGCPTLCLLGPGGSKVCACPENFIEVFEEPGKPPSCQPNCTSSQFKCKTTYKCIPFWWKCDTQDDCGDGSDEPPDCRKFDCLPGQFQCDNKLCIHPSQLCNGIDDCHDSSDEVNCNQHTCMDTQFKCKGSGNQTDVCILSSNRCDGTVDCPLGEDEDGCIPKTCPLNQMMCEDTKHCIPSVWACDGASDCGTSGWDESPELCNNRECAEGMFRCSSGRCIPPSWKCDGTADCPKGEDEPNTCLETPCQPTYFRCDNSKCLPGRWRCDFEDDCGDNSDELNCTPRNCSESEFRCHNQRCIPGGLRCDGEENCMDGSDEDNCNKTCTEQEFMCTKPKQCIYKKLRCDGDVDCSDGSDEIGCNNKCPLAGFWRCSEGGPCNPPHWICDNDNDCPDGSDESQALCVATLCSPYHFRCSNFKCIQLSLVCDGKDSCGDNSDETMEACEHEKACPSEGFKCRNGHCVSKESVCDGYNDCIDNSDEHNCPSHECASLKCSQLCLPRHDFKGYKCACDQGYSSVNNSCSAIGDTGMLAVVSEIGVLQFDPLKYEWKKEVKGRQYTRVEGGGGRAADIAYMNRGVVLFAAQQNSIVISSIYSNTSSPAQVKTILKDVGDVVGLSVDWIGRKLYIAHSVSRRISVTNLNGKSQKTLYRTDPSYPLDIVVFPQKGEILWSEGGEVARIMVGICDGSGKDILVRSGLSHPTGLAIDHPAQRLYWADPKQKAIFYVHLTGPLSKQPGDVNYPRRTLVFKGDVDLRPHRIEVFGDNVFFSLWSQPGVISVNKLGIPGNQIKYEHDEILPTQLIYLHPHKFSNISSPCSGNPCHTFSLCLLTYGGSNYTCVCPDNMVPYHNETSKQLECMKPGCPLNCLAGGTCYMTGDGPRCACPPLYNGPRCEEYLCANKCKNNGICYADTPTSPSFEPPTLKCKCVGNWEGEDCSVLSKENEKETCTNPCLNGGVCRVGAGSSHSTCFCPPGFSGTWCEYCMNRECKHGICYRDLNGELACNCTAGFKGPHCTEIDCDNYCIKGTCTRSTDGPVCKCPAGFSGKRCDRDLCSGLCHNSGKCIAEEGDKVKCVCSEPWAGNNCEIDLCLCHCGDPGCPCVNNTRPAACDRPSDVCHHHKCYNNSTCVIVGSQPVCRCNHGWEGTECEVQSTYPNACTDYCLHGGVCALVGNVTYCYCPNGWHGLRCENNSSCKNYCYNGGTCIKSSSNEKAPTCRCPAGFTGRQCKTSIIGNSDASYIPSEVASTPETDTSSFTKILITAVSLLLVLLITVSATYCIIIQRRRRPFSHVRMLENVEISNPMYQPGQLINDVDNLATEFSIDPDNSNFGNPVYESVYNCSGGGMKEEERRNLLGLEDSHGNDL